MGPAHDLGASALAASLAQFVERAYADRADANAALGPTAATGVFTGPQVRVTMALPL